jgi:hypothetical protein
MKTKNLVKRTLFVFKKNYANHTELKMALTSDPTTSSLSSSSTSGIVLI